jgi:hypothetical protein
MSRCCWDPGIIRRIVAREVGFMIYRVRLYCLYRIVVPQNYNQYTKSDGVETITSWSRLVKVLIVIYYRYQIEI